MFFNRIYIPVRPYANVVNVHSYFSKYNSLKENIKDNKFNTEIYGNYTRSLRTCLMDKYNDEVTDNYGHDPIKDYI